MLRFHRPATAGLALAFLGACSSVPTSDPMPSPTVTVTASADPVPTSAVGDEEVDDSELGDRTAVTDALFGQAVRLAHGSGTIFVSAPTVFRPSAHASVPDGWDEFVVMEVTETNDWIAPVVKRWSIKGASGGRESPEVIDQELGIGAPAHTLTPGGSVTYRIGFGRSTGEEFVVTAMGPIGYDVAVFR